jgi:RNA:NAD 2'-phosphotransferase (TPT1/KptA family)
MTDDLTSLSRFLSYVLRHNPAATGHPAPPAAHRFPMTDDLTSLSRFLSYVLRHNPAAIGIALDEAGWVPVDTLLAAMAAHHRPLSNSLSALSRWPAALRIR